MDNSLNEANYFLDAEHQVQKNAQQEQMNLLVEGRKIGEEERVFLILNWEKFTTRLVKLEKILNLVPLVLVWRKF